MSSYAEIHARSLSHPAEFWGEAAKLIDWSRPWDQVLDRNAAPAARWFTGGRLNTCWNALDRHVAAGRGAQVALIYDSPVTGKIDTFTYQELTAQVALFAGFCEIKASPGDRVIIYMPMVPQAVIAMLACARLGAIHSVVLVVLPVTNWQRELTTLSPKLLSQPHAASSRTGLLNINPVGRRH